MMHLRAAGVRLVETLLTFSVLITLIAGFAASIALLQGLPLVVSPLLTVTATSAAGIPVLSVTLALTGRQVW